MGAGALVTLTNFKFFLLNPGNREETVFVSLMPLLLHDVNGKPMNKETHPTHDSEMLDGEAPAQ